ncbi:MAG TPA: hypothetical protein VMR41_01595 [Patescibacteria group bacterium]|nr:hypothetical protein [Patescibacteria group bacterium]
MKKSVPQFFILISFLTTFVIIRTITHLQKAHLLPNQNGALHIHHMTPGIILLLISGFIGISFWRNKMAHRLPAILFGIGAALTLDEFALWLFLRDVYWARQGRDSVDAVIIAITLISLSIIFTDVSFKKLIKRIFH